METCSDLSFTYSLEYLDDLDNVLPGLPGFLIYLSTQHKIEISATDLNLGTYKVRVIAKLPNLQFKYSNIFLINIIDGCSTAFLSTGSGSLVSP